MTRKTVNRYEHKGFITPDIPPEGEFVYFCVPVPNNEQNIENFLGALLPLTRWDNYQRTGDKRGKQIADIWREIWINLVYNEVSCMDACCPDDIRILKRLVEYNNFYQNFIYNMLDDGTPQSFAPDAPETFDSQDGDESPAARANALCDAVRRYVYSVLENIVNAYAAEDEAGNILEQLPPFGFIFGVADFAVDIIVSALGGLVNDNDAVNDVICHMRDNLSGQEITYANFRDCVNPAAFEPLSNQFQIAVIVDMANAVEANYRAFVATLDGEYTRLAGGGKSDCPCECDPDELNLVAMNDCTVTKIDATHYQLQQANYTNYNETGTKIFTIKIRDEFYRCFDVISLDQGQAGYWQRGCEFGAIPGEGIGGGGGQLIEYELRFLDDTVPYEAIDAILTIGCPPDEEE